MIAFIFPGQGSQTVGMCKGYYDKFPEIFNPLFEEANDTLGFDLKKICLYGPMEQLTETSVAQPAILTVSTGISRVLASMNIRASMVAGHSFEQFSALVEAGVLPFNDALRIVRKRGQAMSQVKIPGSMLGVVTNTREKILQIIEEAKPYQIDIGAYNSPTQVVFSGASANVEQFQKDISQLPGVKVRMLATSQAFHSRLMSEMVAEFMEYVHSFPMQRARIPIILNCSAEKTVDEGAILEDIKLQCTETILWETTINALLDAGIEHFIEVGPGNTLTKLCWLFQQNISVFSTETPMKLKKMAELWKKEWKGECTDV